MPEAGDMVGERVGEAVVVQVVVPSGVLSQHLVTAFSVYPSPHLHTPVSTPVEEVITANDVPTPPPQTNPLHTGATTPQLAPA